LHRLDVVTCPSACVRADTPKEAMLRMAEHRKLSSKINYHVLDDLFSDDAAAGGEEAAGALPCGGHVLLLCGVRPRAGCAAVWRGRLAGHCRECHAMYPEHVGPGAWGCSMHSRGGCALSRRCASNQVSHLMAKHSWCAGGPEAAAASPSSGRGARSSAPARSPAPLARLVRPRISVAHFLLFPAEAGACG
jgi:Brf1-like TBP-binding domain